MVAVTVQEDTTREGAQGIALTVALAAAEELAVQHLGPRVGQGGLVLAVVVTQEVVGEDNLVKQIPVALVTEGTDTPVQDIPPRVKACARLGTILDLFLGTESLATGLVLGIIVQVTHEDDALVRVIGEQRVHRLTCHTATGLTQETRLLLTIPP